MWIMLNDAFFSIVKKDCTEGQLLVRARRPGDIEKVFGRRHKVDRVTVADYLFRAVIPFDDVAAVMVEELRRVVYNNFKDSVSADDLHRAYMRVWTAMADIQNPKPYSERRRYFDHLSEPEFPEIEPQPEAAPRANTETADAMRWAGKALAPFTKAPAKSKRRRK